MESRYIPLSDCCDIRTGQTFKGALEAYPKGAIGILQPHDLSGAEEETLQKANMLRLADHAIPQLHKHLLKDKELLVMNKGTKFRVFRYQSSYGDVVATAAFYVLKAYTSILLPQYLHWYLRRQQAREYLLSHLKGSVIPSITKAVLSGLPVPLLSLEHQQHICDFSAAIEAEEKLLKKLIQTRAAFADSYCQEYIKHLIP